ncbi:hypothetical protein OSTOST_14286 [Ostertagia ostertagi]
MGQCDADREVLPVKYGNDTKRLMFDYLRTIATNITKAFPKSKVLMWYDELKYVERSLDQGIWTGSVGDTGGVEIHIRSWKRHSEPRNYKI